MLVPFGEVFLYNFHRENSLGKKKVIAKNQCEKQKIEFRRSKIEKKMYEKYWVNQIKVIHEQEYMSSVNQKIQNQIQKGNFRFSGGAKFTE